VSRWSETTASTVLRGYKSNRRSNRKKGNNDQFSEPTSRSGSDLDNYAEHDLYVGDKLHIGFS
jgi:hypothetical protein